jgi:hypothetical protein
MVSSYRHGYHYGHCPRSLVFSNTTFQILNACPPPVTVSIPLGRSETNALIHRLFQRCTMLCIRQRTQTGSSKISCFKTRTMDKSKIMAIRMFILTLPNTTQHSTNCRLNLKYATNHNFFFSNFASACLCNE